jgi:DNA adenine methylase
LALVQLENRDALKVIQTRDKEDTFFYIDPPYFNSDCGHYDGYTELDFKALLNLLSSIKGRFLLSSYPSPVLDEFVKSNDWQQLTFNKHLSATSKKGSRKTEVLTSNYPLNLIP